MEQTCIINEGVNTQQTASRPPPMDLGINVDKPKFPHYDVYSKRLESFESWPDHVSVKTHDLAEAGFVFTGVGDRVRCYFCGGGLRDWRYGDVPMEEHAKWYPTCPHILLAKSHRETFTWRRTKREWSTLHIDSAGAGVNHLESVAALSCLEMDFPKEMVKESIDIYIGKYGRSDFKGKDLCEILFDLEKNAEEHSPGVITDNAINCLTVTEKTAALTTLIEENKRLKENLMCKICFDKQADVIFLPCGHMVSCPQCAPALPKCPICRKTLGMGVVVGNQPKHASRNLIYTVKDIYGQDIGLLKCGCENE